MKKFRRIVASTLSAALISTTLLQGMTTIAQTDLTNPELSRLAASEGMILLENKNEVLPVAEGSTVAMFGRAMIDYTRGGGGSGDTQVAYTVNILEGMQNYEKEGKLTLVPELVDFYTKQVVTNGIKDDAQIAISDDLWARAKSQTDTAIVTIGRYSTEGKDRNAEKGDYYLSDAETALLTKVASEFEKTVVVLNIGAVIDTSWINDIAGIDSVLVAWQGGMEGGNATANVLMGTVNPSGKTVDTWAKSYDDYPSSQDFKETVLPEGEAEHANFYNYVNYTEDIFVGYRYFETIPSAYDRVNYEFGYGLSYTDFTTTVDEVKADGENIVAKVTIKNVGDVAGKEVVQLYFTAPDGLITKPKKELAAFDKTGLLQPNESQTLTLTFPITDMSSYDDIGQVQKSAYVLEKGDYKFFIGNSVRKGEYAEFKYTINDTIIAEQLIELCKAIQLPKRLQADGTYKDSQYYFPVSDTEETIVQMELYSKASSTVKMERFEYNTYLNGFSIGSLNAVGDYVEYGLNAKKAGQYAIYFSYANGYSAKTDIFDVTVNGTIQAGDQFDVTATSASATTSKWFNFALSTNYIIVDLAEGENIIRFTAKQAPMPNFDYMVIKELPYSKTVAASGVTKIEAESFDQKITPNGGVTLSSNGTFLENFNNSGTPRTGSTLSYNIHVEKAGKYKLSFNANYSTNALNNFSIFTKFESKAFGERVFENLFSSTATNNWSTFLPTTSDYIELPEGNCILSFGVRKGTVSIPNIDSFNLEYVGESTDPTVQLSTTQTTVIEAEDYVSTGWTVSGFPVYNETSTVDNSKVCVAYVSRQGNYLTWWVNAPESGEYNIVLNYANGSGAFTFNPKVTVNGIDQSVSLSLPKTSVTGNTWYNFIDSEPFTVELEKGFNVLKFECTETNKFPNIDYLKITYASTVSNINVQSNDKIMILDVYNDATLMDAFLEQMTNQDLANLLSAHGTRDGSSTQGLGKNKEYGIPLIMTSDGPQGIRLAKTAEKTTAWPISTCLASSWDEDVVAAVGKAIAGEAHYYNMDIWLAPGMNIHRDPLCGRNFEYYSEDPLLTGKIAASITNAVQAEGVGVSVKHFAANNREQNRMNLDSRVSERALREIYLRGFEIVVKEANPWTVMSSYNIINGTKSGENYELLTGILRGEWGYAGVLFTDWQNNSKHVSEVLAGNDIKMTNSKPEQLLAAVDDGVLTRDDLKEGAERVVKLVMKSNYFKDTVVNVPVVSIQNGTKFKVAENIIWSEIVNAQTTSDEDGGKHLALIKAGAYTEYQINVVKGGTYTLSARVASPAGDGSFKMLVDGVEVTNFSAVKTGGYDIWKTVLADDTSVYLEQGTHTLKLEYQAEGFNLNWIEFANISELVNLSKEAKDAAIEAQKQAENAQKAAEDAQAAAQLAAQSTATDKTAVETAKQAAELAKEQAETAKTAAETALAQATAAKDAAEASNTDAAAKALESAASATAAANSASTAAQAGTEAATAAQTAQNAQAAAEAAKAAAQLAAQSTATDKTAAETAKQAAELAKEQAKTAKTAAETALTQATAARDAAEQSNSEAAAKALEAANKAAEAANSASTAANAATQAAVSAQAAQQAKEAAEQAADKAENDKIAAEQAKAEAEKAAAKAELILAKCNAVVQINQYADSLISNASSDSQKQIEKALENGINSINSAQTIANVETALNNAKSNLDKIDLGKKDENIVVDKADEIVIYDNVFTDVHLTDWFKEYVDYTYTYGIFKGNENGAFEPSSNITRAQFVQVLANLSGVDTTNKKVDTKFNDVKSGDWFAPAVKWAVDNGIVAGIDDKTFAPNESITREQMCVMLVNYAKSQKIAIKSVEPEQTFSDDKLISDWAKDAVYTCQQANIVNGIGEGEFNPQGTGKRSEAAVIFTKFHQAYIK